MAMLLSLTTVACSSTVMRGGREVSAGGAGAADPAARSDVAGGTAADAAAATASTVSGSSEGGAGPAGARGGRAGAAGASGGGGAGGPGKIAFGRGITDTTIRLGFWHADAAAYNAAGAALGGSANFYQADDPKGIQSAVIDYVNAHGGIAGRKIVPVWHELLASNAATKEGRIRDAQTACATYTEDNSVFAFMGSGQWTEDNIVECAARTKTVLVDEWSARTGVWLSEKRMAQAGDYYYTVNGLTAERRERAMVDALARQGFFTPGAKVAVMTENQPSIREGVNRGLKPALAAKGVNVATEIVYPDIIESPWQSYVLQLQTERVTHVIFSAATSEGWPTLLFMRGAESQTYRPQYGISGLPAVWIQGNAPREQLRNARGMTWLAGFFGEQYPPLSETDKTCRSIMRPKGYPEAIGGPWCDYLLFLKQALEQADALTPAGLAAAAGRMGGAWRSTRTFDGATMFEPGRRDGAHLGRTMAWSEPKGRFDFTSAAYPIPR